MIRVVKRCMSKNELKEYHWDYHPAFIHFGFLKKNYINTYIDGKPLKWWHILRKGCIIECVESPADPWSIGAAILLALGYTSVSAGAVMVVGYAAIALGIAGLVGIGTALTSAFSSASTAAGSSSKTYSSTAQAELNGASNDISNSILPVLFGKTQQTPNYGQLSYRYVGDGSSTNKLNLFFISNYNNVVYSDYKLENSSTNDFSVDKLDIDVSYGGSSFIGFDNCKALEINEQLSYDSEGEVQQSNNWNYNHSTTSTTVKVDFIIEFTNVVIASWGNKTFNLKVNVMNGATPVELNQSFTITSGDLTLVSGTTYRYSGTKTFTQAITSIVSTSFYPTAYTRTNSAESTNELDATYISETITTDTWLNTKTFNQAINYYLGTISEVVQTSPANTNEIDIFISFPSGLYTLQTDGSRVSRTSKINIQYKEYGTSTWNNISSATSIYVRGLDGAKNALSTSTTTVSGATVTMYSPTDINLADQLFFRPIGFTIPNGKYVVRVRSADYSDKTNYDIGYPYCAEVQFRVDDDVIDTNILPKVNQISVIATAYKGLSGTLKKFNYIGEAEIPVWDGTDWETIDKSTNPAAIIRYLLTDTSVNPRAISTNLIDNDTLVELYNWCEDEGYTASGIISDEIKISEVIGNILANCQSTMIPLFNGKHTFAIDKPNKTPIGLFNQHNSFDFKWYPTVGRQTTAIRATFLDNDDYTTDELTVYWYDGAAYETIKSGTTDDDYDIIKKEYKYVNDRASVLKIAKYDLNIIQSKRNNFEFSVNLEALNMMLLDRVYISNTTNMENESTGLIKDIILSGNNLIGFQLYSEIEIAENSKIIIRSMDNINEIPVIYIYDVLNSGVSDVINIAPIAYNGNIRGAGEITGLKDKWHYDGDLFSVGQDTIYDCLVIDVKYNENNTATIIARDY